MSLSSDHAPRFSRRGPTSRIAVAACVLAALGGSGAFAQTTPTPTPPASDPAGPVTAPPGLPTSRPLVTPAPPQADGAAVAHAAASQPAATPSPFALWIRAEGVATDNGTLAASGQQRRDVIARLTPRLTFFRRGPGLTVDVDASATARAYANDSQSDRIVPDARAAVAATLVERWVYLDASARAREVEADPFAAPLTGVADGRGRTAREMSITPALRRDLSTVTTMEASHTLSLIEGATGSDARRTDQSSLVRFGVEPLPLGGGVEFTRRDSRGDPSGAALSGRTTLEQLRGHATLRLGGEVDLSLVAGTERSRLEDGSDERDAIAGVGLRWHPGPRTNARLVLERRFFGTGVGLAFAHRMPFLATTVEASRGPQQAALSTSATGFGNGVPGLLDAMLTTRHGDEGERRALVDAEVQQRGLATGLAEARRVETGSLQLVTGARIALALMGLRNVVVLSAQAHDARRLERDAGASAASPAGSGFDHRQYGARLDASHRLTPLMSLQAGWRWSRIDGLGDRDAEHGRGTSWHASLSRRLGPRTVVSGGILHQRFESTATSQQRFDATALLAGMSHRF